MSVSRDGLLLSARASEVNFLAVLKRAPTTRCPGSRKKASINQKTCGQTSQKGQRSERLKSQGGSTAQVRRAPLLDSCRVRGLWLCFGFAAAARQPCGRALSCETTRESLEVVHHAGLARSHSSAVNDGDHCRVSCSLISRNPWRRDTSGLI